MQTNRRRSARLAGRIFLFTWWPYLALCGAVQHFQLLAVPFWKAHGEEIKRALVYDRQALLWEYEMVRDITEQRYPNLDWTIEKGKLDLERLDRDTITAIEASTNRKEGARAIRRFVRAFDDRHFAAARKDFRRPHFPTSLLPDGRPRAPEILSGHTPADRACAFFLDLDWTDDVPDYTSLDEHPDFSSIEAPPYFPTGILKLRSDRRLGVIRIGSFSDDDHPAACRSEWERFRLSIRGTCEDDCQESFWYAFRNRLVADFSRQVERLAAAKADVLVLDLAGNGGGHDWYQAVVRTVTPKRIPCPRAALVRTDEARRSFRWQAGRLRKALRRGPCGEERRLLEEGLRRAEAILAEVSKPCGRDWVFPNPETGAEAQAIALEEAGQEVPEPIRRHTGCSAITTTEFYGCGFFSDLDIGPQREKLTQELLFSPNNYAYRPGLWSGPLAIIVDKHTGSAAELTAGMLQDWAGAVVVGEPSSATGTGYYFGMDPVDLPVSGLELYIPSATAWRRDGRNYREGITPDIRVWWYDDDTWETRVKKLGWDLRVVGSSDSRRATP